MSDQKREPEQSGRDNNGGLGGNKGPNNRPSPNMMSRSAMAWIIFSGIAVLSLILMNRTTNQAYEITPQEFLTHAKDNTLKEGETIVENERMRGELKEDVQGVDAKWNPPYRVQARISSETKSDYCAALRKEGHAYKEDPGGSILLPLLINLSPVILIALLIYFFVFRGLRNAGGGPGGMLGNFGRSRHKITNKEHSDVTLADVAGVDEAKEEVAEIIEFLKNPKKFQRLGGRVPRGVLLIGDPGCGKTLLARAVAGEADVPFFSISGSDFVEMFVGVGASRVRDLFKQAKESSPCIIFLDEVDAVGRRRGSGFASGGHDEREQTLNAILVEMDGFDTNDQVIVMAATNRSDVLDPALTRPGRFDRQIHVPLPDIRGRMEILKVHSQRVKMNPNVDLERLARGTPMFSGADLEAIINEAAIGATLQGKDFVEQDDLEEARDKIKWGRARRSHKIEEEEKTVIAYHEAGHTLVTHYDEDAEPLHKVTIIPRGQALGVTLMLPEKDKHIHTRKQLMAQLRVTFGGRIAEELFCGDVSSGAAQDIRQATAIARAMVTEFGMSEKLGFLQLGLDDSRQPWEQSEKLYSEETAKLIDEEIKDIIDRAYAQTRELLEAHRTQLRDLAEALLKHETLNSDEVDRVLNGQALVKTTVGDLLQGEIDKITPATTPPPADDSLDHEAPGAMPSPA